jgi:hypothetical protein
VPVSSIEVGLLHRAQPWPNIIWPYLTHIAVPSPFGLRIHLLSLPTRVIDVMAVVTAKGEKKMTTTIAEQKGAAQDTAAAEQPKANKKASAGARSPSGTGLADAPQVPPMMKVMEPNTDRF